MLLPLKVYDPRNRLSAPAHPGDAGYDIRTDAEVSACPDYVTEVPTGIHIEMPPGFVGLIADKSGLAKRGVKTLGGVIDSGFSGEIVVMLTSVNGRAVDFDAGDKVAQLLIIPVATPAIERVADESELTVTERAGNGFGSTGVR